MVQSMVVDVSRWNVAMLQIYHDNTEDIYRQGRGKLLLWVKQKQIIDYAVQ